MNTPHLPYQEILRREKLEKLKQLGVEPYPAALFPVRHHSADILKEYTEEQKDAFSKVTLAGRVMSTNDKGKVLFIKIQDSRGNIQLYVCRDDLSPGADKTLSDK